VTRLTGLGYALAFWTVVLVVPAGLLAEWLGYKADVAGQGAAVLWFIALLLAAPGYSRSRGRS
jgi:hypothetical protein